MLECELPNKNLHSFNGQLIMNNEHYSLSDKQLLLKGANLKNTDWVVAICVYTGQESKIMLNSQKGRQKMSHLESKLNTLVIFVVLTQCFICAAIATLAHFWQITDNLFDNTVLEMTLEPIQETVFLYFTYFLLMNTLLPVSLQVTLEVVKTV